MKDLKKHFLGALVFLGTISFGILGYAAWTNLTTVQQNDPLTDTRWNEMVQKLNTIGETYAPSGAVIAFYLTSCPTGWKIADGTNGTPDLRGAFIRANITSSTYDPDYANRTGGLGDVNKVGSSQSDAFQGHFHNIYDNMGGSNNTAYWHQGTGLMGGGYTRNTSIQPRGWLAKESISDGTNGNPRISSETRPKNVALLYCVKE